jgi:fluoroacetyl-CoA thioesterase
MNFDTLLKIGDTNINEYIVKQENTADFLGNEGVTVLSTPSMIGFMEATAAQIVTTKLPENYRPVGTKINIEHINSTPVNSKVTVKATLMTLEGKRLRFNVEAFNEKCKIGFGEYEQHIINLNAFLNKR